MMKFARYSSGYITMMKYARNSQGFCIVGVKKPTHVHRTSYYSMEICFDENNSSMKR